MEIKKLDYGIAVTMSEGEAELVIVGSYGQSGHCSLVMTVMAVDGGYQGVPNVLCDIKYGELKADDVETKIKDILTNYGEKLGLDDAMREEIVKAWTATLEL
jgi:hypothetical protein